MAASDTSSLVKPPSGRERILDAAYELFSRAGVRAIGVDTITAEADVAKMTLYRNFASKNDLALAFLELRDNTFFASITLTVDGKEMEIDSRPSDALALAVRSGAPIFAAEEVIAESAIEFEHDVEDTEEVVEKFKDFLDQVSPEDFAGDDG